MASAVGTPGYIIERCKALKGNWSTRDKKFSDWYNILLQEDKLAQEGMESVVTNDPRTGYNLAKHLLISMIIADKVPSEELTPEQIPGISYLESFISKRWDNQERRYRKIGRQSWIGEAVSWLLATGWYSVFSMVTKDEIWAEVWSPADCYPDFGTDGLVEHAHIYTLSPGAANRKVKLMGWTVSRPFTDKVDVYDHWTFDATGSVVNAVVMGDEFVKTPVVDSAMSKLGILPIFTSPAGGLPDRGSIKSSGWQEHYGECLVATNEGLNDNYNRMRTFYQQSARYGAQHHWLETSQGDTPIATDEIMSRWGSVLHGQPGEDVRAIQPAAMPVELTNIMYTYQNELQRGLFPSAVFGNVQQQMSYLAMANVASASLQVLTPYIEAFKGLRTDIDNFWTRMLLEVGLRPYNFKKPTGIPEETEFDVSADVEIPGYLIQRATVSRMLNPQFRLPNEYVMERMFPDIKNSLKAQADTRKEDAMAHPKAILVDQILAYREQARMLRELEPPDTEGADLYEKLAKSLESELDPQTQQPVGPGQQAPVTPAQEVMPQESLNPIEGMGRMA